MALVAFKSIFPSPLGYVNFGESNRELNEQLIKDIDKETIISKGKENTFKKNDCAWQSSSDMENRYKSFEILRKLIDEVSKPILRHSCIIESELHNLRTEHLWSNLIFDAGGYSRPHFHGSGNTLWSGVYYPKGVEEVDDLDKFEEIDYIKTSHVKGDGYLILYDPAKVQKGLVKTLVNSGEFMGDDITIIPRESLLILFPVWLEHMVSPLTSKIKRYSISFAINKI